MFAQLDGSPLILVICGICIGALLLMTGLVLGAWLARRGDSSGPARQVKAEHMMEMLGGLSHFTHGFAGDVSNFRSMLQDLSERLQTTAGSRQDKEGSFEMVREILQANDELKQRLDDAEESLKVRTNEVSTYLSEARTDALTQLPNRRAFDAEVARRFAEWTRYGSPYSLLILDIDFFKKFNDTYGHQAGDAVLCQVARVLSSAVRDSDLLVRLGGEEFAVILPASNLVEASVGSNRLLQAIRSAKMSHEGVNFNVTLSCGVAQAMKNESVNTLIKRADTALYAAKDAGRDRAYLHDGQRCVSVDADEVTPISQKQHMPENFANVCDNLRQRLIEVTRES